MWTWTVVQLLFLIGGTLSSNLDKVKLDGNGNFVDSNGRVMLFHGFNAVLKEEPWYPAQMLNRTQLNMFRSWGINVVRLGVMWSGVMPQKNQVDEKYLSKIEEIVDACADFGIYVLLDMHQDVISTRFGAYDGFPRWFVDEVCRTPARYQYPWPFSIPPKNVFVNYLTYACVDCADQIYENASGAWTYWGDYWKIISKKFASKDNVIGYELVNEPPPPNYFKNPWKALPAATGRKYLLPLYDYLVDRIRSMDSETLIFYEPMTYGVFFPDSILDTGTGFDRVPDSQRRPDAVNKSVLSYHYYCWPLQSLDPAEKMTPLFETICDAFLLPSVFLNSLVSATRTGGGRFLTEFGLCAPDGNPSSINTVECNMILEMADAMFQSWMYWDGNFLDKHGNPIATQISSFARTYPQKTLGTPHDFKFDSSSGEFRYSFKVPEKEVGSDLVIAEIFVPKQVHYFPSPKVHIDPSFLKVSWADNVLQIIVPAGTSMQSYTTHVHIGRF